MHRPCLEVQQRQIITVQHYIEIVRHYFIKNNYENV